MHPEAIHICLLTSYSFKDINHISQLFMQTSSFLSFCFIPLCYWNICLSIVILSSAIPFFFNGTIWDSNTKPQRYFLASLSLFEFVVFCSRSAKKKEIYKNWITLPLYKEGQVSLRDRSWMFFSFFSRKTTSSSSCLLNFWYLYFSTTSLYNRGGTGLRFSSFKLFGLG